MKEWVGTCGRCGRDIYCLNGFLNGIVLEDRTLICFTCEGEERERDNRKVMSPRSQSEK